VEIAGVIASLPLLSSILSPRGPKARRRPGFLTRSSGARAKTFHKTSALAGVKTSKR